MNLDLRFPPASQAAARALALAKYGNRTRHRRFRDRATDHDSAVVRYGIALFALGCVSLFLGTLWLGGARSWRAPSALVLGLALVIAGVTWIFIAIRD